MMYVSLALGDWLVEMHPLILRCFADRLQHFLPSLSLHRYVVALGGPVAAIVADAASLPQATSSGGGTSILWEERCSQSTVRGASTKTSCAF